jgi:predicted Zn finger-like uncharacterized protein
MLIVCPSCSMSYQIEPAVIGADGRSVRCVRCRSVWFATPPVDTEAAAAGGDEAVAAFRAKLGAEAPVPPAQQESDQPPPDSAEMPADEADAAAPDEQAGSDAPGQPDDSPPQPDADTEAPAAVALADIPIPIEDAPPLAPADDDGATPAADTTEIDNGPDDIESVARRRAAAQARRQRARRNRRLPALILALAAICALLLGLRKNIVRHVPQLASLYASIGLPVNLRGLAFTDLKVGSETRDGVPVLVVEGTIVTTVARPVEVPRLRFALRNAKGAEVYAWTAMPTQPILQPGAKLPFRSRLASPPKEGHDVQVRFFTRRDAVAGVR